MLSLPIETMKFAQGLFDFPDLTEYLMAGTSYDNEEADIIVKILDRNLDVLIRAQYEFQLFSKIYHYVDSRSFFVNQEAVILPYMDICNIIPNYLTKPDNNYTNSSYVVEEGNKFIVKSTRNFVQSEQYLFSYNVSLDNDKLILKQGVFVHDNIHSTHTIDKRFEFENGKDSDEIYNALVKYGINPESLNFIKEEEGREMWLRFKLRDDRIDILLFSFGIVYYDWRKKYDTVKNNEFKYITKQALQLILRIIYDEKNRINNFMEAEIDEYMLRTEQDRNLTEVNKNLRNFNMEKIHLLNKNINYVYKDLVPIYYKEIMKRKEKYTMIDPNRFS
jgi:hypothetical protein